MKKFHFISLILILFCANSFAQTQLANGTFETWTDSQHAQGWKSDVGGLFTTATRVTDVQSGTYAAKITTSSFFGQGIPGIMMLGDLDVTTFLPSGGVPFANRPTSISAYLKYNPATAGDTMIMFAYLTKWNIATLHTDTIGATFYMSGIPITSYTKMNFPLFYLSSVMPDTINVGFAASFFSPKSGSTLFIDDVTMEYGVQVLPTIALPATNESEIGFNANWLPPLNATSYALDVAYDQAFTNFVPNFQDAQISTGNSSQVTVAQQNNPVYYRVRVNYGATQTSLNSNIITVTLPYSTTALPASNISTTSFLAHWQPVQAATNYRLEVATDANFQNLIVGYNPILTGNVTSYLVSGLSMQTTYYYRISAIYNANSSIPSNVISLLTDFVQSTPKILKNAPTVSTKQGQIQVSFTGDGFRFVTVYNTLGQPVYKQKINSNQVINISSPGLYIIHIKNQDGVFSEKIIVE